MKTDKEILDAINKFKVNLFDNPNRPEDTIQTDECEYCGKKLGKNPLYVHINTDGTILPNDITEEDLVQVGMQSQGCFPIGQNCAKNLLGDKLKDYAIASKTV